MIYREKNGWPFNLQWRQSRHRYWKSPWKGYQSRWRHDDHDWVRCSQTLCPLQFKNNIKKRIKKKVLKIKEVNLAKWITNLGWPGWTPGQWWRGLFDPRTKSWLAIRPLTDSFRLLWSTWCYRHTGRQCYQVIPLEQCSPTPPGRSYPSLLDPVAIRTCRSSGTAQNPARKCPCSIENRQYPQWIVMLCVRPTNRRTPLCLGHKTDIGIWVRSGRRERWRRHRIVEPRAERRCHSPRKTCHVQLAS